MEQNKREQFIIRRIGGTTYKVKVVFNESGYETMEDKILRIVRNDMVTNDGTYGIMEIPQMSRQSERSASSARNRLKAKLPPSMSGCPATMTTPGIAIPS